MDFDRVADELYALAPTDFAAARDERAAAARAEGDATLSAAIKKLRKPTVSAWLANLLAHQRAADVDKLLALGASLRDAQSELAGAQLRELSRRRHQIVVALSREAQGLGRAAGVSVADAAVAELEATLEAAIMDPSGGEALSSGRLTAALHYAGTGLEDAVSSPTSTATKHRRSGTPPEKQRGKPKGRGGTARRERAAAARAASAAAKSATRRTAGAQKRAARLHEGLDEARSSLEQAKSEVHRLEDEMAELETRAAEADHELRDARAVERTATKRLEALRADER